MFSLGLVAEYDVGRVEDNARGVPSSLVMQRVAGGLQAQLDLWRFQLYARGTPGAIYATAELEDPGIDRALEADGWTWAVDVTGGARFRLASAGPTSAPVVSFWMVAEGGYSFAGDVEMTFAPGVEEDDPRQFGTLSLPSWQRPRAATAVRGARCRCAARSIRPSSGC
jgi:hypothetical protein